MEGHALVQHSAMDHGIMEATSCPDGFEARRRHKIAKKFVGLISRASTSFSAKMARWLEPHLQHDHS